MQLLVEGAIVNSSNRKVLVNFVQDNFVQFFELGDLVMHPLALILSWLQSLSVPPSVMTRIKQRA